MAFELTPQAAQNICQGHRLITLEDFVNAYQVKQVEDGSRIHLIDSQGNFLAKALVGRQHKGLAWVFTTSNEEVWSPELLVDRLAIAFNKRHQFSSQQTTAYRLFNGEGDGIGAVTIDYYDGYLQINWYSKGIYAYRHWLVDAIITLRPDLLGIYETKRFMTEDGEKAIEHTWGSLAPQPIHILENGLQYAIYLGEDWMTGLFLDQREVRQFVQMQAAGLSVLNLFSYTGGFSVAAAAGGADCTVSVDVANRSIPRTHEQFALNQISTPSDKHEIRVMDVFDYVNYAQRHDKTFDMIVCDPPSFARTKKYRFKVEKDYVSLADQLFSCLSPGGFLILSTNHSGYYKDQFMADMLDVANHHGGQLIQSFDLPADFPTSQDLMSAYLKVLVFYG